MRLREILLRNLKSWVYPFWVLGFIFSLLILGIFMYARTIEDEHISGAFGLAPMILLLILFFITFSALAINEFKKSNRIQKL